jgi:outer membrane protein assembly factor BamB
MGQDDRPHRRLRLALAAVAVIVAAVAGAGAQARGTATRVGGDWARFGYDAARHDVGPAATGITAANVRSLRVRRVALDGTVDSSAVYVRGIRGRDLVIFTTTYGKTEAVDASTGARVWRYIPPSYASLAGTYQITNSTPIVDRALGAVFAAAPDGRVRRLNLATGRLVWSATVTLLPAREKMTSPLNLSSGRVLATTGGYIGDQPPYQGHVVTLDEKTGRILSVWNSLCSERTTLQVPSTCPQSDSAIWARSGAVVDPATGRLLVATGNALFDGKSNFGDSVLVLSPDGKKLVASYTPTNQQELNQTDLDLGSTAPALLAGGYAVQGGKDGELRLLGPAQLTRAPGSTGGELQLVPTPGSAPLFSALAVWQGTRLFVADSSGTAAWRLSNGRLVKVWDNGTSGTSPIAAGGLLYVLSLGGGVNVYRPATGALVATLPTGSSHWQSPIVTDGRVIVAEGNANDHATTGVLNIFRLP